MRPTPSTGKIVGQGIKATAVRTGITRMPHFSPLSQFQRVRNLPERPVDAYPGASTEVSQRLPTFAISTSQPPTACSIAFNAVNAGLYGVNVHEDLPPPK